MDHTNALTVRGKLQGVGGPLVWTTAEGQRIPIRLMETSHLFNAMKMTFNHLAAMHGGEPVWFTREYCDFTTAAITGPQRLARIVVAMLAELETRRDLPEQYAEPLAAISTQIYEQQKRIEA